MAKEGEISILRSKGESAVQYGLRKPFSAEDCPDQLARMGVVMALLPPAPARVLDLGCGMGWTSLFLARRGYDVVGVDISPDKVHANQRKARENLSNVQFRVHDYEGLPFDAEFDAALFYDALHHAVDEHLALAAACRALKPGGMCITSEPGDGHADSAVAQEAVRRYNVTERDMPPRTILRAGAAAGFRGGKHYPHPMHLWRAAGGQSGRFTDTWLDRWNWFHALWLAVRVFRVLRKPDRMCGMVVLTK